nr:hypothetical protein [uncultured Rhodopila sp.]
MYSMRTFRGPIIRLRMMIAAGLIGLASTVPAHAFTLWSDERTTPGGAGLFFGPGSWTQVSPLFPVVIRGMGFVSDVDFATPFFNNNGQGPATIGEKELGLKDGRTSDGSLINENVDTGTFTVAGTRMLPVVARSDGKFGGSQAAVSLRGGDVVMAMDLTIDLGIGPRGIIKIPFYGTTGTVTVPPSLQTQSGGKGVDQAGKLASGTTIAGRVGDFNHDGYIDGTLVAVGVMPMTSPIYPGQPFAMVRNFATDIPVAGVVVGAYKPGAEPSVRSGR